MDGITQAVLGAAIAEAGFRRELGPKAITVGAICGFLPDLDLLSALSGPWGSMIHHRGFTHSVFFAPLVAPLLGWLAWRWAKRRGTVFAWGHLAFWTVFTHPLLDVFTSFGTQLLFPASNHRFAVDGVAVVDPLYTLPLMAALLLAYIYRKRPNIGRLATQAMLVATTGYLLLGTFQSHKAKRFAQEQLSREGFAPTKVRATPTLLNIWLWRIIAHNKQGDVRVGHLSTLNPKTIAFVHLPHNKDPLVQKALASDKGRLFRWFSMGAFSTRKISHTRGTTVLLQDQRYGLVQQPTNAFMGVRVEFDRTGKIRQIARYRQPPTNISIGREFKALWGFIWNGKMLHP